MDFDKPLIFCRVPYKLKEVNLVPEKSLLYLMDHNLINCIVSMEQRITMQDFLKNTISIRQLLIDKEKATLGVVITPSGTWHQQIENLTNKAISWCKHLNESGLTQWETWQALNSTIIKTLEYCLPVLYLACEVCDKIMRRVIKSVLAKMRIWANFPCFLIYASPEECGLGILNIYELQALEHIKLAIEYLQTDTITGQFLDCS